MGLSMDQENLSRLAIVSLNLRVYYRQFFDVYLVYLRNADYFANLRCYSKPPFI